MKALKISLAVIVIASMGAVIFLGIQNTKKQEKLKKVKNSENQFIAKIEKEIEKLKTKSAMSFCKEFYREIEFQINVFYNQGHFGKNQLENDQWKENLEKTLYSVYAEKFIKQAFYVFSKSEWEDGDLESILAEKDTLKRSVFLETESPVDEDFTEIQEILDKYNEIVRFISYCNDFSDPGNNLSDRFPIADVQRKIERATSLRQNHLENEYVNNCVRLHDLLKEIPQYLFREHIKYLDKKIDYWSDMYSYYNSQTDYSNNLYKPIKSEIDALDNNVYNADNFYSEFNRLLKKWRADNIKAYEFEYNNSTDE